MTGFRERKFTVHDFTGDGGGPRQSKFYSAASLEGKPVPTREWLVNELVPSKTVTLFSGDGGTGKSLLALQLAVAVAAGGTWLGRQVKPGRVIVLSAEDDEDELHRRLADVTRTAGVRYSDLAGLTLRSLAGEDALLAVETQLKLMQTALFDELEARAADEGPALITLDTAADTFPANENDRASVRQFIGILRGLALRQRCAVLLLSHPSLTGLNMGLAPTRAAVFADETLKAAQPFMSSLKDVFTGATPRPITPRYPQVSLALQSGISRALVTGKVKEELEAASAKIDAVVA